MIDSLRKICELQTQYSADNTPAMEQRGALIRRVLPGEFRAMAADMKPVLQEFGSDFAVEGSDGIGRKTEAPWTRIYSRSMSPSAREGYYVVVHFAANGSAVFVTLGCGSTIWTGGDLRHLPPDELDRRTQWARAVVGAEHPLGVGPFTDQIRLGARARLPQTFERATALAKRVPAIDLEDRNFRELIIAALERLTLVYRAQRQGRDLHAAQQVEALVEEISSPVRARSRAQGFGLSSAERKMVEERAMFVARQELERQGFAIEDRSANNPFDFMATRAGEEIKVEVKGTTGLVCDAILMTHTEVALHRREKGATALVTVAAIRLVGEGETRLATGGIVAVHMPWMIDEWDAQPIAFKVSRQ